MTIFLILEQTHCKSCSFCSELEVEVETNLTSSLRDCEQVQSALEDMLKAECPSEILSAEGTGVKYFKDFEDDNSQVSCKKIPNIFTKMCRKICLKMSEERRDVSST